MKQIALLKNQNKSYGGELLKTRAGRSGPRPLDTKNTMHLVLRSSKAKGDWSFARPENNREIKRIIDRFSKKYFVQIISVANVGNHIHLHIRLLKRCTYNPFIRAITSAIRMAVTKTSRWNKSKEKFWDYRPFTRVVIGFKALLKLKDYIRINQLEGFYGRTHAELIIKGDPYINKLLAGSG